MNPDQRPIFLASEETKQIQAKLESLQVGEIATWQQLAELTGGSSDKVRASLITARHTLLKEKQMVFCSVRGVGYKRINDSEILQNEGMTSGRIKRAVKRSLKRLAVIKPDTLEPQDKTTYAVTSATLGALALCAGSKFENSVKQRVLGNGSSDPAESLKLFLK